METNRKVNSVPLSTHSLLYVSPNFKTSSFSDNFRGNSFLREERMKSDLEEFEAKAAQKDGDSFSIKIVKSTHCREGIT